MNGIREVHAEALGEAVVLIKSETECIRIDAVELSKHIRRQEQLLHSFTEAWKEETESLRRQLAELGKDGGVNPRPGSLERQLPEMSNSIKQQSYDIAGLNRQMKSVKGTYDQTLRGEDWTALNEVRKRQEELERLKAELHELKTVGPASQGEIQRTDPLVANFLPQLPQLSTGKTKQDVDSIWIRLFSFAHGYLQAASDTSFGKNARILSAHGGTVCLAHF